MICCREFKKCTRRLVSDPLRFSFANGQKDVSTSFLPVPYLHWKVIIYIRVLNAPGPALLGTDVHEDLGLVVDHVDCTVFLSHLQLENTVERLPSRHLAWSLCTENVTAHYEAMTPETRELEQCLVSEKGEFRHTCFSGAYSWESQNQSKSSPVCVYRVVLVKNETTHDSEIDPSVEPHTSCDQAICDYDVISQALENVDD